MNLLSLITETYLKSSGLSCSFDGVVKIWKQICSGQSKSFFQNTFHLAIKIIILVKTAFRNDWPLKNHEQTPICWCFSELDILLLRWVGSVRFRYFSNFFLGIAEKDRKCWKREFIQLIEWRFQKKRSSSLFILMFSLKFNYLMAPNRVSFSSTQTPSVQHTDHIFSVPKTPQFNTKRPLVKHQNPSVPNQKPLSSTQKTPQFNMKPPHFHTKKPLSSTPKTSQFNIKTLSTPLI